MAKKRKSGSRALAGASIANQDGGEQTRHAANEQFADSEDEFFAGRDKVLLDEGPARKKLRRIEEDERFLQPSDEEVLPYQNSDEDEYVDEDEDESGHDLDDANSSYDENTSVQSGGAAENEENIRDWGSFRADYYNTDAIETEADALEEEAEARRLQQKQLQGMTDSDFAFDETHWAAETTIEQDARAIRIEKLPDLEITDDTGIDEKTKILKNRYPEFEPLAKDFEKLKPLHEDLRLAAQAALVVTKYKSPSNHLKLADQNGGESMPPIPNAVTKFRALSTYLGSIALYFALLTSSAEPEATQLAVSPSELRDHPIVSTLFDSRGLWDRVKNLEIPEIEDLAAQFAAARYEETTLSDGPGGAGRKDPLAPHVAKKRKSKAIRAAEAAQKVAVKEKAARLARAEESLEKLDALVAKSSRKSKPAKVDVPHHEENVDSDYGDETPLTATEALEKARRKKSLRFYTSQIAQKSNKRGLASREAGGDADLPYKERLKDRQDRLMREAERRGRAGAGKGEELNDEEENAHELKIAREVRGESPPGLDSDSEGYYDMIAANAERKKREKKARADDQVEATRQGVNAYAEETVGADGKRAISYTISKNKGLAPRRKKEVRNPRVKKRMKYDEKMKKLGSIRQVYRGGEGKGGYSGELTGIKRNLVKSVKL